MSRKIAVAAAMSGATFAAQAAAWNHQGSAFPAFNANAESGVVMAANDANFDASHLSEALTEYVVDTPDAEGLEALIEALFPAVLVGRSFSYLTHDTLSAFQAALNDEDIREIGGKFGEVRRTGSQVDGRTDNKGLIMWLDNDQGGEDAAIQQAALVNLKGRLLRADLIRGEALLEANDTAITPNWGPANAAADPDGDLVSEIDLGGDARGINSNTVLYGGSAWTKRFLSLGQGDNAARHQTRNLTPAQLAALVRAQQLLVSDFRYQSSASAKAKMVGDKVFTFYSKPGATKDDPSNIKRFVTPVTGGGMWRSYIIPDLKRTGVCLEHYSRLALTSSLGIRKIAPTYT